MAYAPQDRSLHPSVSPSLARAFDGFFGPPARELRGQSGASVPRQSVDTLPTYEPREGQAALPVYSVLGRFITPSSPALPRN
ncbi:hypothetical protein RhiJN_11357 [Ceratobasidium sp. AG-Ba]|nr:hypothetical protein RhiJN_11357 [Ceratobasidium sp. AG-Ba]QRW12077.1 hypothetical protein RhiLY_11076 [Ceratobasidium sp. AG-Ba]